MIIYLLGTWFYSSGLKQMTILALRCEMYPCGIYLFACVSNKSRQLCLFIPLFGFVPQDFEISCDSVVTMTD